MLHAAWQSLTGWPSPDARPQLPQRRPLTAAHHIVLAGPQRWATCRLLPTGRSLVNARSRGRRGGRLIKSAPGMGRTFASRHLPGGAGGSHLLLLATLGKRQLLGGQRRVFVRTQQRK